MKNTIPATSFGYYAIKEFKPRKLFRKVLGHIFFLLPITVYVVLATSSLCVQELQIYRSMFSKFGQLLQCK